MKENIDKIRDEITKKVKFEELAHYTVEHLVLSSLVDEINLKNSCQLISAEHYDDVVEERAISDLCGYALCCNHPAKIKKQYQISLKNSCVYDLSKRKNFCSCRCYEASDFLRAQIPVSPVWARENEPSKEIQFLDRDLIRGRIGEVILENPKKLLAKEMLEMSLVEEKKVNTAELPVTIDTMQEDRSILVSTIPTSVNDYLVNAKIIERDLNVTCLHESIDGKLMETRKEKEKTPTSSDLYLFMSKKPEDEMNVIGHPNLNDDKNINTENEDTISTSNTFFTNGKEEDKNNNRMLNLSQSLNDFNFNNEADILSNSISISPSTISLNTEKDKTIHETCMPFPIDTNLQNLHTKLDLKEKISSLLKNKSKKLLSFIDDVSMTSKTEPIILSDSLQNKESILKKATTFNMKSTEATRLTLKTTSCSDSQKLLEQLNYIFEEWIDKKKSMVINHLEECDPPKQVNEPINNSCDQINDANSALMSQSSDSYEYLQKVKEFYSNSSCHKNDDEMIILPSVDSYSQSNIQRKIVYQKIYNSIKFLSKWFVLEVHIWSQIKKLISHFRFTNKNILLSPTQWNLATLVFIKILIHRNEIQDIEINDFEKCLDEYLQKINISNKLFVEIYNNIYLNLIS